MSEEFTSTKDINICSECGKQLKKFYRIKSCRICYDKKLWERKKLTMSKIKCKCSNECKEMIWPFDLSGRPSMFKQGHNSRHPDYCPPIPILKGENNPNWKGGRYIKRGYVYVRAPDHPNSDKRGYIREHVKVVSDSIGRPLKKGEQVHHKDQNKLNNDISNLMIVTKKEHLLIHLKKDMTNRLCELCGTTKTRIDSRGYAYWHKYQDGYICVKCYRTGKYYHTL